MARSHHQLRLRPIAGLLLLLLLVTITLIADCARATSASAPAPATANKPIEIYPGCAKTVMPKRCSFKVLDLINKLKETKSTLGGPQLAAGKLKSDSCIAGCAKVVDELTPLAAAAKTDAEALDKLKEALKPLVITNDGPLGPCQCACPTSAASEPPEPCAADESAAVAKLEAATDAMDELGNLLVDLIDGGGEEKKAEAAEMERSMDSGVVHVSCGLTRQPRRCADELAKLVSTTRDAEDAASGLRMSPAGTKLSPEMEAFIEDCTSAVSELNEEIESTEYAVKSLQEIRAKIRGYVKGEDKDDPGCKPFSCPKPCSANETAVVEKLNGVRTAWIAADKFLTELLPPGEEAKGKDEAPK